MKILIIEDDERIVSFVKRGIEAEGFKVDSSTTGEEGYEKAKNSSYSLIILDVMLPGISGIDVCHKMRLSGIDTPILMLTALDSVDNKVEGLKKGADDYLTKPFAFDELLARIEALLRRNNTFTATPRTLNCGHITINDLTKEVAISEKPITLTTKEYALLYYFASHSEVVVSRAEILRDVWGHESDPLTNVVDVCVFALRRKLGEESGMEIQTMRGFGYIFKSANIIESLD